MQLQLILTVLRLKFWKILENFQWKGTVKLIIQFTNVIQQDHYRKKVNLGLAEGECNSRIYNHKLSSKHKRYSSKTTLSSYIWHLKIVSNEIPNLKQSVLRFIPPYPNISNKCLLYLYVKLEIVTYKNQTEFLNKRSELLCKCCHPNKFLLKNYTGNEIAYISIYYVM